MKTTVKAIMFKSNGNEIKTASVTLNKWIDSIFYTDPDPEDYNSVNLFIEHNGVFAQLDRVSQTTIKPDNIHIVKNICADIEGWLIGLKWINLVHLEFAKQAGLNYDRLLTRRNEIKAEREAETKNREAEKAKQAAESNAAYAASMAEIKEKLKAGDLQAVSKVIECYNFYGFKVHPRTLGTMYKINGVISTTQATKPKGMSWDTHGSIIQTVKDFIAA